ncbi:MAG: cupin domain-containing protein [Kiritimatiellaeota bacterium]|nr:cupin domain-containing protein [Kiritimatiellota bacterium]
MITRNTEAIVEDRVNMRGGKGTVRLEHWFRQDDFKAKVRLCTRMVIAPGATIGEHAHEADDEIYIVLSGQGRILENGEWQDIRPGDAILTGNGASHSVENTGDAPLVIAAVIILY